MTEVMAVFFIGRDRTERFTPKVHTTMKSQGTKILKGETGLENLTFYFRALAMLLVSPNLLLHIKAAI